MGFIQDILKQPSALKSTLEHFEQNIFPSSELHDLAEKIKAGEIDNIIFSGMGASLMAHHPSAIRFNKSGVLAFGIDAAELHYYRLGQLNKKTLLILVSQSGESIETVKVARSWLENEHGILLSLTNKGRNTLSDLSDLSYQFPAGEEEAVSTKTYSCTLASLSLLTTLLLDEDKKLAIQSHRNAIEEIKKFLNNWQNLTRSLEQTLKPEDNIILLGRGPLLSAAHYSALIMKEALGIYAEGMNAAEYRHGPLEASGPEWPAILFVAENSTKDLMLRLASELADHENPVAIIGADCEDPRVRCLPLSLKNEYLSPFIEILPIQTLIHILAKKRGLDPSTFRHAKKITSQE